MSDDIKKLWAWLAGKKTYLIAIATAVYGTGIQNGWWQSNDLVWAFLGGGGLASLKHGQTTAINKALSVDPAKPPTA